MLTITRVFDNSNKIHEYGIVVDFNNPNALDVFVDIFDTDKNDYFKKHCCVTDGILLSMKDDILGILNYDKDKLFFYPIRVPLWKLFEISDGLIELSKGENNFALKKRNSESNITWWRKDFQKYQMYSVWHTIYKHNSISGRYPLFFKLFNRGVPYGDLLDFYLELYKQFNEELLHSVFYIDFNKYDKIYRLDMNEEIFRFLLKCNVAGFRRY
jgi:hypothetical protein